MTVLDIINKIENGSVHILIYDNDTGAVELKTIWHNTIPQKYWNCEVKNIIVKDYELRLGVEML